MENKKGQIALYIILIIIVVCGWLFINNIYIPYRSEEVSQSGYHCENKVVVKENGGLLGSLMAFGPAFSCSDYLNSRWSLSCNENNKLILTCKTTIYTRYFSTEKEGEWFFGPR